MNQKEMSFLEIQRNEQVKSKINLSFHGLSVRRTVILVFSLLQLHNNGDVVGDQVIATFVEQVNNPFIVQLFTFFSSFGSKWGIITSFILALILIWWKYRDYTGMGVIAITVIGGDFLNKWVKGLVGRERPLIDDSIIEHGYSFPSGHAMVGLAFYGFVTFLILKEIDSGRVKYVVGIGMSVIIFLIGASRVILNAHYSSDVVGGFAIGFLFLLLCINLYRVIGHILIKHKRK